MPAPRSTMSMMIPLGAAVVMVVVGCTAPSVSTPKPTVELTDCAQDTGIAAAECGKVEVYEDRAAGEGRTIDLT